MKCLKSIPFLLLLILGSCAPKIRTQISKNYDPLKESEQVIIFGLGESIPEGAEALGIVKISDTGFTTNCNYDVVLDKAKQQARKAGGNALLITDHNPPTTFGSTCHRISATIFRIKNPEGFAVQEKDNVIPDKNIALLHIYRPAGLGPLIGYDVYLDDTLICRAKNKWKETVSIGKGGRNIIWARTEAKVELPMELELGREYYIRCGMAMGVMVGHPTLQLVDTQTGRVEFNSIKEKLKK